MSARSSSRSTTRSVSAMSSATCGYSTWKCGTKGTSTCVPKEMLVFSVTRPRGAASAVAQRSASSMSASTRTLRS